MNPSNGNLYTETEAKTLPIQQRAGLIPVVRDLTMKEKADRQIRLYAPCGCGSGKKFKFCCWTGGKA